MCMVFSTFTFMEFWVFNSEKYLWLMFAFVLIMRWLTFSTVCLLYEHNILLTCQPWVPRRMCCIISFIYEALHTMSSVIQRWNEQACSYLHLCPAVCWHVGHEISLNKVTVFRSDRSIHNENNNILANMNVFPKSQNTFWKWLLKIKI